jgi:hypothetical protein
MKRVGPLVALGILAALAATAVRAAPPRAAKGETLTVLTRNLYLAATLDPLSTARMLNEVFPDGLL